MEFKELKIKLIEKNLKFIDLVKIDGRSYQYLHKNCRENNKKVLKQLYEILNKK